MATENDIDPNDIIHASDIAGKTINLAVRIMHSETKIKPLDMLLFLQRYITDEFIALGAESVSPLASDNTEKEADAFEFCQWIYEKWDSPAPLPPRQTLQEWFFEKLTNRAIRVYRMYHAETPSHVEVHSRIVRLHEQNFNAEDWHVEFSNKAVAFIQDGGLHTFHVQALFEDGAIESTKIFTIRLPNFVASDGH